MKEVPPAPAPPMVSCVLLRGLDQFLHVLEGRIVRNGHTQIGLPGDVINLHELERVIGRRSGRSNGAGTDGGLLRNQKGITIRGLFLDVSPGDVSAGAGHVLQNDRNAQNLLQEGLYQPDRFVIGAARRVRDDKADRFVWDTFRRPEQPPRRQRSQTEKRRQHHYASFPSILFSFSSPFTPFTVFLVDDAHCPHYANLDISYASLKLFPDSQQCLILSSGGFRRTVHTTLTASVAFRLSAPLPERLY